MQRIELKEGNTLILHGPASAILIEGKASILGCPLSSKRRLIVKSWRSRPIYAERDSIIECTYGEGGGIEIIDGDTIPAEWREFAEKISAKPVKVCVYGGVDSGKTSLATFLANSLVRKFGAAVYLDLDLGQSNICPPTTIGYAFLKSPVPDISYLKMESGEPVGYTSPTPLVEKHINATGILIKRLENKYPQVGISVDFDGWISGDAAIKHKQQLLSMLKPDFLASIGPLPDELKKACEEVGASYEELPPPFKVRKREQAARRRLREIAYNRFLRKSLVRKIPISWLNVLTLNGLSDPRRISMYINRILEEYSKESGEVFDSSGAEGLEELAKKRIGLLSYLHDVEEMFAGIGLLVAFNVRKNYLKILTPFEGQIKKLIIGAILLSIDGEEIYSSPTILAQAP